MQLHDENENTKKKGILNVAPLPASKFLPIDILLREQSKIYLVPDILHRTLACQVLLR